MKRKKSTFCLAWTCPSIDKEKMEKKVAESASKKQKQEPVVCTHQIDHEPITITSTVGGKSVSFVYDMA